MSLPPNAPAPLKAVAALAVAISLAVPLVQKLEGYEVVGYYDVAHVATNCWGHTGPEVRVGVTYAERVCLDNLSKDMMKHGKILLPCTPADAPPRVLAAAVSFTYNTGTFCTKTIGKRMAAGDYAGVCRAMSAWVYVKDPRTGKYVVNRGLVNRRAKERAYCESGLK